MIFYSIETVDGARISSSLEQPTQDERESFRHGSRSTDRSVAAWRKTQENVERRAAA